MHEFIRAAFGHQCALVQYGQRMTAFRFIHVMSGNQDSGAFIDKIK